ncbi:PTS sugar transporter subunit IIA [Romboutsia sp.]|uniref:PTS sugar transporter subunit IIA n=1 Tax=Romboutsia sp. TaxID=1965302 RepID=UPI003F34578F
MYIFIYINCSISPSFSKSVFYRESLSSTNIDDFLAIPHPMELNSIKTKICVALLESPIEWNEGISVNIVMMLAINENDYSRMDSIYDIFLNIINNELIKTKLLDCFDILAHS